MAPNALSRALDCIFDVACRSDKLAKAIIIAVLNARGGSYDAIITSAAHRVNSTGNSVNLTAPHEAMTGTRAEKCRMFWRTARQEAEVTLAIREPVFAWLRR